MSRELPDMQKETKGFPKIAIEKVGVRGNKLPLKIQERNGENVQTVTATISSYCSLDANTKGINMSRIARTLHRVVDEESMGDGFRDLTRFTEELNKAHGVDDIYVKTEFDYLIKGYSPMTKIPSYEPVQVVLETKMLKGIVKHYLTVKTVEMSLCPCSKEMSLLENNISEAEAYRLNNLRIGDENEKSLYDKIIRSGFGAHNQKSMIDITVELTDSNDTMWIEDLVEIAQGGASSPTFAILKRPDEKYVTERSYMGGYFDDEGCFVETGGGPAFVEDISRRIAEQLNESLDKSINDYVIVVNNQESIHSDGIVATSVLSAGRNLK
jgi:GTP cyclohydrolase I